MNVFIRNWRVLFWLSLQKCLQWQSQTWWILQRRRRHFTAVPYPSIPSIPIIIIHCQFHSYSRITNSPTIQCALVSSAVRAGNPRGVDVDNTFKVPWAVSRKTTAVPIGNKGRVILVDPSKRVAAVSWAACLAFTRINLQRMNEWMHAWTTAAEATRKRPVASDNLVCL